MSVDWINPLELGPTPGYSNGCLGSAGGRTLFVAGQIGVLPGEGTRSEALLAAQFGEALRRILVVVAGAGGVPADIGRMTAFVTDLDLYRRSRKALGGVWKTHMGAHYPAMSLVEVKSLLDPQALVEIEATAIIGGTGDGN